MKSDILIANVTPDGKGAFTVKLNKPTQEIGSAAACQILGVSRGTLWSLRDHPVAGKILQWRFNTPAKRRVLFTVESVLAYLAHRKAWSKAT